MIMLSDIRQAVITLLRDNTDVPVITGESLEQERDYEEIASSIVDDAGKEPEIFQVLVEPTNNTTQSAQLTQKSVLVDIAYSHGMKTKRSEWQNISDVLDALVRPVLNVKDRYFTIDAAECNFTDYIGHYVFYIRYTDGIAVEEGGMPKFKELDIKLGG